MNIRLRVTSAHSGDYYSVGPLTITVLHGDGSSTIYNVTYAYCLDGMPTIDPPTHINPNNILYNTPNDFGTAGLTLPNTDGHTDNPELVLNTAHYGPANATAGTATPSTTVLIMEDD